MSNAIQIITESIGFAGRQRIIGYVGGLKVCQMYHYRELVSNSHGWKLTTYPENNNPENYESVIQCIKEVIERYELETK